MHKKNIRGLTKKQLKYNHPHWKKMTKQAKKDIVVQIMEETKADYDFTQPLDIPIEVFIDMRGSNL